MPSEKQRSKEDTWKPEELAKSIKEATSDKSERKKHRDKDRDKERRKDRHRERDDERNDSADRRQRDKDKERRKERREDGEHRKDREREGDRSKEKERRERKERHREKEDDSRDRHKDKERHRDRDREKRRDDDDERRREERRRRKEEGGDDKERRKHRDGEDKDRRRRHKDEEEREDKERRRRHRDKEEGDDDDRERRRREKERRHREKTGEDREVRHREERDREERDRDKHRDRDRERRHKERSEDDDEERRRRHEEKKRRKREEEERKKEEERNEKERSRSRKHREEESLRSRRPEGKGQSFRVERHQEQAPSIDDEELKNDAHGVEVTMGDDDAGEYNYDEDDFEDYDDDFEDDDGDNGSDSEPTRQMSAKEREIHELRKAIEAENMATLRSRDRYSPGESPSSGDTSRPRTGRRTFVNFVAAKQRVISDKVSSKTKKRGKELMRLIDLDIASFDMFDLPPTKEYEMYIKSFGRSNTRQAYVQCNEDNIDRDIQTDEIDYRQKWTQFPADDMRGCGGVDGEAEGEEADTVSAKKKDIDSARLVNFLQSSGQVITVLLEENLVDTESGTLKTNQRQIVFSDGYTQLNQDIPFLKDRYVVHLEFHPVQTHLILTAYSKPKVASSKNKLANQGLVCLWNINEPSRPQKVLSCQSSPLSCCFSPTKATLAFAGTADGSVVVWDLREPSAMHHTHSLHQEEWVIRIPTYSTDGVNGDENHHSPVSTVLAIVSPMESVKASFPKSGGTANISDETVGLSFQLATIEEQAIINFWTVVEISNPDKAGSVSDLGLTPGGKVKLIKSSFVKLDSPSRDVRTKSSVRAFQMQLLPKDPNHLYVGTDLGCVIHAVRYGGKAPPKSFRSELDIPVDIVTLDFSPFGLPFFVAGCTDGSLRLHNTTSEYPMVTWHNSTNGMAIIKVQWSRSRPSVFYVVDETAKVYVWDLLERDGSPVKIEQFSGGSLTTCALSNDHAATGLGLPGRRPELAIAADSGMIEIHRLNDQFNKAGADELDRTSSFLEKIM